MKFNKNRPFSTVRSKSQESYHHAIILSKLTYCLPIWSLTTKEITTPIERQYNRAYKIHGRFSNWTHHCIALAHSNALTFTNYANLQATKLFHQIQSNHVPPIISALIPDRTGSHSHTTRSVTQEHIRIPPHKNNFGLNSFIRTTVIIWNELPLQIRSTSTVAQFKKLYTSFLKTNQLCTH